MGERERDCAMDRKRDEIGKRENARGGEGREGKRAREVGRSVELARTCHLEPHGEKNKSKNARSVHSSLQHPERKREVKQSSP